jgi:DNA-binding GntR family transcriptional regulator
VTRVLPPNDAAVRNASVAATELIRNAIIEGRLEPGRRLKEEELARELGISRTPVRDDLRGVVRENLFFHNTILTLADSARLTALVRKVIELPLVYNSYRWYSGDQMRISVHYHGQITKALDDGDADRAELIMKEHVLEARDVLVAHVRTIQAAQA